MNRNQATLAAIGGAGVVLALAAGALVYVESDSRAEKNDDLESQYGVISRNAGARPETAKAHKENAAAIKGWADDAYAVAEKMGIRNLDADEDPSMFRQRMERRQRELVALPEGTEAKIIKPDFKFGERFQQYIDGAQPPASEMAALQREWDDVTRVTDILLEAGATELTGVAVVPAAKAEEQPQGRGPGRRAAASSKKPAADPYPGTDKTYVFTFLARPEALVRTLGAIASDEGRFMSVDSFEFAQSGDPLKAMVGGEGGKEGAAAPGGRRGGRRGRRGGDASAEAADGEEVSRKGIATDPATAAPFTVTMKITTTDFARANAKEAGK